MNYETAQRALVDHFTAQWAGITPLIGQMDSALQTGDHFARITVKPSSGSTVAIGGRRHRREGQLIVQVFTAQSGSISAHRALEERATRILETSNLTDIRLSDIGAADIGFDGEGWYQSNVRADWSFDI